MVLRTRCFLAKHFTEESTLKKQMRVMIHNSRSQRSFRYGIKFSLRPHIVSTFAIQVVEPGNPNTSQNVRQSLR